MRFVTLAALAASAGCAAPAIVVDGAPATTEVVVANQQSASASIMSADGATMKHVTVGSGPHEAAISPDGRIAVVTIYGTQTPPGNQLAVIDLVRDSVIRTIDLGDYRRPHGAAFLGNRSDMVVVTSEASNNVVIVDLNTGSLAAIPTNARASHMIAVTADGTRGWTTNVIDNSVSEIDIANRRFIRSFSVPARPEGIAVTPDGSEVWVGSNETGTVSIIDTRTGTITHTLTGTTFPYRLGASPDGSRMAIVDGTGNALVIADVAAHAITARIALDSPRGVAIAPDNRTAWVTLAGGSVALVDLDRAAVVRTLPVQASPDGVAVGTRR